MRAAVTRRIAIAAIASVTMFATPSAGQEGCPDSPVERPGTVTERDMRSPVGGVASRKEAMIFYLARGPAGSCGANCTEWIAAEGQIMWDTHKRLIAFLDRHSDQKRPIVIDSTRQSHLGAALSLGRIIRERGLNTMTGSTTTERCAGVPDAECFAFKREGASMSARIEPAKQCDTACVLMLAGGIQRSISSGTRVSVGAICVGNRLGAKTPIEHREGVAARGYEQFELYFAQMGIHRDVIETIYRARSLARQIRIPERDWWRLRLATEAPL